GLDVLFVEVSWDVGQPVKALLDLCGATVAVPAATIADAEVLLACHLPDVAIVDLHLRGGERSDSLIGRLREQGVPIIMFSGSFELASLPSIEGAIILEKRVSEDQLIEHCSQLIAKKRLAQGF